MAIKITVSPRAKFYVEGTEKDEDGKDVPFKFGLLCKRTPADQLKDETSVDKLDLVDFMVGKVETWFDVLGEDGQPVEFSEEGLRQLLRKPGLAMHTYFTYLRETGAKAKN